MSIALVCKPGRLRHMDIKVATALCAESCFHSPLEIPNCISFVVVVVVVWSTVDTKNINTKMQNAWDIDGEVRTWKSFCIYLEDFFRKASSLGTARI